MASYNFTVRATDSLGAFADRNFQIDVQRTRLDRFIGVYTGGIIRSTNGVNWVAEPVANLNGGAFLTYTGGNWVAAYTNGIHTSIDAINWTYRPYTTADFPTPASYTSSFLPNVLKFFNGQWYAFGRSQTTKANGSYDVVEWRSSNGITWTYFGIVTNSIDANTYPSDFEYDAATDTTALSLNGSSARGVWTRVGTNPWVYTQVGQNYAAGYVARKNGVWFYVPPAQNVFIHTSRDGLAWQSKSVGSVITYTTPVFNNGKWIIATNSGLYQSSDAGNTWSPHPYTGQGISANRYGLANYAGNVIGKFGNTMVSVNNAGVGTSTIYDTFNFATPQNFFVRSV